MEDDNQLSEEDLARKMEIESFEDAILHEINKMKDEGLEKAEFNNMIFELDKKTGEFKISLKPIDGLNYNPDHTIATVSELEEIKYFPDKIREYNELCKAYEVEPKLPEGLPEIEALNGIKEREGDDSKEKTPEEQQQEMQKNDDEQQENQEENQEGNDENQQQQDGDERKRRVYKTLPKNAVKLNKNRMADPRKKVGEELENATGEEGVEFYVAPVGNSNNLNYKLFIYKNGVYEELDLPTPRGTNPTDNILRMGENNMEDRTAVSIIYIGKDRAITVFNGGPHDAEVDIANRDYQGEFSSTNIEKIDKQGKVGYAHYDTREAGGDTVDARISVEEKKQVYLEIKELEQREVPDEINPAKDESGIELRELSDKEFRKGIKDGIKAELLKEGKREVDAENMAEAMTKKVVDENKEYSIAKEEAELENEEAGKTPWDNRENKW